MKNFTKDDIEVAVLTYNRAALLPSAVQSILDQDAGKIKISIFDNGSQDGTKEAVEKLIGENPGADITYFRHEKNVGGEKNALKAVSMATKPYIMLFHDDDILHPSYVSFVLKALNGVDNLALITSRYSRLTSLDDKNWAPPSSRAYVFENCRSFAAFLYCDGKASFSCAVYKTERLKAAMPGNAYGKVGDAPQMIRAAGEEKAVVFKDKRLLRYRIHAGQDSENHANGPFEHEIIAHKNLFKSLLGTNATHKAIFALGYAPDMITLEKFAGKPWPERRDFLKRAYREGEGGIALRLCSLPVAGKAAYFMLRRLRELLRFALFRSEAL